MLTKEEKQIMLQLLDLANKAGGINVAQSCIYFVKKFELDGQQQDNKREDRTQTNSTRNKGGVYKPTSK